MPNRPNRRIAPLPLALPTTEVRAHAGAAVASLLRRAYDDTASEPLPDALTDLLKRLG